MSDPVFRVRFPRSVTPSPQPSPLKGEGANPVFELTALAIKAPTMSVFLVVLMVTEFVPIIEVI